MYANKKSLCALRFGLTFPFLGLFLLTFTSNHTRRVIEKVIRRNLGHYLRSGGIASCSLNGGEVDVTVSELVMKQDETGLIDIIDNRRRCKSQACEENAFVYWFGLFDSTALINTSNDEGMIWKVIKHEANVLRLLVNCPQLRRLDLFQD